MAEELIARAMFEELQATAGPEFVAELLGTFFEEAPLMLADMRAALALQDGERFRRAAHSLKTNAHTFGAMALGARARELELGGLPPDASGVSTLAQAYAQAAAALKDLAGV